MSPTRASRAIVLASLAMAISTAAFAQMTRGGLVGTVRDSSGAVIPGVTVTVTNMDTNAVRTTVSDEQGTYRVAALEPGRYRIVTELQGFAGIEQRDIQVRAAMDTTVDFTLKPGGLAEQVTVQAEAANVGLNKTNPTIGTTISSRAVEELPLPGGRNINNLVLTVPNVSDTTGQGSYSVNGSRPRNNNYMVDGSDNNDISVTIATSEIVPEAVAEFQVLQNPYTVEFGRNTGGQINVLTKSGTNSFRGDAWDYYQSSGLNSRNNIEKDQGLDTPARLVRHQMGGDLGGPIYKDRAFFYGLYQRDTQRPGQTPGDSVRIPTPAGFAALQGVPLRPGQSAASRQAVLGQLAFLQDVFGQGAVFRDLETQLVNGVPIETGDTNVNIVAPSTYHTVLGRVDTRFGTRDTLTVRYSLNDSEDTNQISNCDFGPTFCGSQSLNDTNFAVSNTHIFGPQVLNEARFSLVRRDLAFPENDPTSPTATISGLFTVGGASNFPQSRVTDTYQLSDTLTWTLSRHTLKAGADVRYNKADNLSGFDSKGTFTFDSLEDFMNNNAFRLTQALQTASWNATQWQSSFFIQDDFRLTPELTINAGLRYELAEVPLGLFGATDPESLAVLVPGPVETDTNNWAPRVGFAYSPQSNNWLLGDGNTVFRGGFGIGYDVIFYNLLTVNGSNYPRVATANTFDVVDVYPGLLEAKATPEFDPLNAYVNSQQDTENPEQRFYSFSVQREIGNNVFEIGYSGSRGYKGINQILANPALLSEEQAAAVRAAGDPTVIPSVQERRLFPDIGNRVLIPATVGPGGNDVEARSRYNAFFVSGQRRLTNGLQVNASYTWSQYESNNDASLGEGGTDGSSQRPQNMFDYDAEWSVSQYDRPHRFTAAYLWEIPGPRTGVLGQILGGWQVSGVTSGQSGRPFTIVTGVDSNGDANTGSDRPNVDGSGSFTWDEDHRHFTNNGFYVVPLGPNGLPLTNSLSGGGNAGRNTERAAAFWNTDLALMKRFHITGTTRFIVRIDAFNVLNQDNYGKPVSTMSSASFGRNTNDWGRRILQLSGKISF
jgi:hypothetical protein